MSGCACMIDMCDSDGPDVFTQKDRVARKEHECGECGGVININDKYEHYSGCYEGSWATFKTCKTCVEIRECFCCSYCFGEIWTAIHEAFQDGDWKLCILDGLGPEARIVMCNFLQELMDEDSKN